MNNTEHKKLITFIESIGYVLNYDHGSIKIYAIYGHYELLGKVYDGKYSIRVINDDLNGIKTSMSFIYDIGGITVMSRELDINYIKGVHKEIFRDSLIDNLLK